MRIFPGWLASGSENRRPAASTAEPAACGPGDQTILDVADAVKTGTTRFQDRRLVTDTKLSLPLNLSSSRRLAREWTTMAAMVGCHCRDQHRSTAALCAECRELLDYATVRLERCRFGVEKPTCARCPVHCYQRDRREQMKRVMRHAGPRMLWRHPILSLWHWLDGFRPAPFFE